MIKSAFIKAQRTKAAALGATSPFLRRLVARTVTDASDAHYGEAAPIKCLQVACATQAMLERLEIASQLWAGAFCAAEIFEEPGHDTWGGFWSDQHHVWIQTQFGECVDLNAARLHAHPLSRRPDGLAMPPVWWDAPSWSHAFIYLPDTRIAGAALNPPDDEDLAQLLERTDALFTSTLNDLDVHDIGAPPMLDNPAGLVRLLDQGNVWLTRALAAQRQGIPFPLWVQERYAEIDHAHRTGREAPSRLAHRPDLFAPNEPDDA